MDRRMLKLLKSTKNFNYFFLLWLKQNCTKKKTKGLWWKFIWCINEYVENLFHFGAHHFIIHSTHRAAHPQKQNSSNGCNNNREKCTEEWWKEQPNRENWTMKWNIACTSHCIRPLEFVCDTYKKNPSTKVTYLLLHFPLSFSILLPRPLSLPFVLYQVDKGFICLMSA